MKALIVPRVHMNGDTKATLTEGLNAASHAVVAAKEGLRQTAPNARNFYVISPSAFAVAVEQYRSRQERLQSVYDELLAIFEAIENGEVSAEVKIEAEA